MLFLEGQGMNGGVERKAFTRRQGQSLEGIAIDKFALGLPFVLEESQHLLPQGTLRSSEPCGIERHSPKDREGIIAERGRGPGNGMLKDQSVSVSVQIDEFRRDGQGFFIIEPV